MNHYPIASLRVQLLINAASVGKDPNAPTSLEPLMAFVTKCGDEPREYLLRGQICCKQIFFIPLCVCFSRKEILETDLASHKNGQKLCRSPVASSFLLRPESIYESKCVCVCLICLLCVSLCVCGAWWLNR